MQNCKKLIMSIILVFSIVQITAQEIQFGDQQKTLTDGPYIFWQDSQAVIKYILNDNLVEQILPVASDEAIVFSLEGLEGEFEISRKSPVAEPYDYQDVTKLFAISDIHGQYNRMVDILIHNKIIDQEKNWRWNDGHLIILGDVFDRGPQVTECLWLIHKLEKQAAAWKGKVHFLLGNHEVMVLQGDDRYIHDNYRKTAEKMNLEINKLFGPDTEMGRWLRTKNTIEKIDDMLFCHAGLHPEIWRKGFSLIEINNRIRNNLDLAKQQIKNDLRLDLLFGSKGPLWYRGYFQDSDYYKQIGQDELWKMLDDMAVSRIIVGHTTQDFINPFFKDRVIPIDTGIKYGDEGEGLLWKKTIFYRAKASGQKERVIFQ